MRFEKVSFKQYCKDCGYTPTEEFKQEYENIKLPKRATKGSAGYDFFLPFSIDLEPNETIKIPTGIRWYAKDNYDDLSSYVSYVLQIYPRSGLGFKYQLGLANTVGIIDEDYYESENGGHIQIKLVNHGTETIHLDKSMGFVQGIVNIYWLCDDDESKKVRNGGFGSTDK